MLAKVEGAETTIVVTDGRVGLRLELEGVLIRHRDARYRIVAEQRLLERLADRLPAQITNAGFQQVAQKELLQIGPGQGEASPAQQFGQPFGHEGLLACWHG